MVEMKVLLQCIEETEKWAIDIRRDLHRWPELGNKEYKTMERIERELHGLGISTERILETGLIGTLTLGKRESRVESTLDLSQGSSLEEKKEKTKVIALRADIDGLPIKEEICCDFSSTRQGLMHACGHDVHMAVLLGTARVLNNIKEMINGTVKFIFQPAEETCGGAERMIEKGCLMVKEDNGDMDKNGHKGHEKKVDYVLGLHVKPDLVAGTMGIKYGKVHASSDLFQITIKGKSSHGAYPHEGIDAIVSAAQLISNMQSIVARNVSPIHSAVISFGCIHGGIAHNIIADSVMLEGTIRTLDENSRVLLKDRICEMAEFTAKANRAEAEITFEEGYPALINDNQVLDLIKLKVESFLQQVNLENLTVMEEPKFVELTDPTMGVEDFSYFLKEAPGAFLFLGSGFENKENPGLHSKNFQVNEDCIKTGILVEVLACLKLLEN